MSLPNNTLSLTPVPAAFIPPRNVVRFSYKSGQSDIHPGGIAIGDATHGLSYQNWTAFSDGTNVLLSAPNTPAFVQLANVFPTWVALAFDQNARPFIGYTTQSGFAFYYWFNTLINQFQTSQLPTGVWKYSRIFAAVDDLRPQSIGASDIILTYTRLNTLYMRVQRDRYGVEYILGTPPTGQLVQVGMNLNWRFQFAFQQTQATDMVPPIEYAPELGINEPS